MAAKDAITRFWSRVVIGEGCWEWTGHLARGYGSLRFRGKEVYAHRVAWIIANGDIPDGGYILHSCDNPKCVRLDHLRVGTQADNMRDRSNRKTGWAATGDRNGARLHPECLARGDRNGSRIHIAARPRGEASASSKLTASVVVAIRRAHESGDRQVDIATAFGITQGHVSRIVRRVSWGHV